MSIAINVVVEPVAANLDFNGPHRILYFDKSDDFVSLMRMAPPWHMPIHFSYSALGALLERAEARTIDFRLPSIMLYPEGDLGDRYRTQRDIAWGMIEALVTGPQ